MVFSWLGWGWEAAVTDPGLLRCGVCLGGGAGGLPHPDPLPGGEGEEGFSG